MTRTIYRALGLLATARAVAKGPEALAKHLLRRQSHKTLARIHRKVGL